MTTFNTSEANNNTQPDLERQFGALIERRILENYGKAECFPALRSYQGAREILQINVHATQLPSLLKAKPSGNDKNENDPLSGKNRPVVKGHTEEIKQYVINRAGAYQKWILGTLTANISKDKIEIDQIWGSVCLVTIPRGVFLDITDGQHRTRAIQELIMSDGNERDLISDDFFPITLVLEDNYRQCQTDFRDMAQTAPLPKSLLVSFGALGRDGITQELIEKVPMFRGKTQKVKASPGSGTKFIYTSNYIARSVSCALANDPSDELLDYDYGVLAEVLIEAFNQFFPECSDTKYIFERNVEELTIEEVNAFKEDCILGVSVGLEILGRLLYLTYDRQSNCFDKVMVSKLAKLDWSRDSNLWDNNIVRKDPKSKHPTRPYKISASATNVRMAITAAKEELGWQ